MQRNLVAGGRATTRGTAYLVAEMQRAFPDAMVEGYASAIPLMVNHPKDRHVLAAAVVANAAAIVTTNVRDFPRDALEPWAIEVWTPDECLLRLWSVFADASERLLELLREQAADLVAPPMRFEELLNGLAHLCPRFVDRVRSASGFR